MSRDLRCLEDMSRFGDECADELEELEQDAYHLLIQTTGTNLDDLERGLAVDDTLSDSTEVLSSLPSKCEAELGKDDRVGSVSAVLTEDEDGNPRLEIKIAPTDETLGSRTLVVDGGGLVQ